MPKGFKTKSVKREKTVGEKLKLARIELGLTLSQAEEKTQIREKYLAALEADNFDSLPASVYILGFLQRYAAHLELDPKSILFQYKEQRQIVSSLKKEKEKFSPPSQISQTRFVITPKVILATLAMLLFLGMFGYILNEIKSFASGPSLEILEPLSQTVTRSELLIVAGKTDDTAALTINNQPVTLNPDGSFNQEVKLDIGVNTIEVVAKSRTRKESRKNIVVLKE